jgi:hypothetical protein
VSKRANNVHSYIHTSHTSCTYTTIHNTRYTHRPPSNKLHDGTDEMGPLCRPMLGHPLPCHALASHALPCHAVAEKELHTRAPRPRQCKCHRPDQMAAPRLKQEHARWCPRLQQRPFHAMAHLNRTVAIGPSRWHSLAPKTAHPSLSTSPSTHQGP